MTDAQIKSELKEMMAEIMETESEEIKDDAQFVTDLGMDSMMALEVLASLEKKYKIVIPEEELLKFTTLNNTVEVVSNIING
ncbi:MAG: acyl carrier protein [Candidatus Omnitrophica bacterium]|nr:acyl carrier protein [Candidatus Omnitrophota bacterium]